MDERALHYLRVFLRDDSADFRPHQLELIRDIVSNPLVLGIMKTSGGKTLPAVIAGMILIDNYTLSGSTRVARGGCPTTMRPVCLIISPLRALPESMTKALADKGINACLMGATQRDLAFTHTASKGHIQFIVVVADSAMSTASVLVNKTVGE